MKRRFPRPFTPAVQPAEPLVVGDEVNLMVLLRGFMRDWMIILALAVVLAGLAALYGSLATRYYEVVSVLSPSVPEQSSTALGNLPGGTVGAALSLIGVKPQSNAKTEAIAYLKSRGFAELFIADEHLMPKLFPDRWDSDSNAWRNDGKSPPSTDDALAELFTLRTISVDDQSGLVTLRLKWRDRTTAADLVRAMTALVNNQVRNRVIHEANSIVKRVQDQLSRATNAEIRATLTGMLETQIKIINLAEALDDYAFKVIDPPLTPDERYYVWPWHLRVIIVVGFGLGLALGAGFSLVRTVMGGSGAPSRASALR